ncbi:AN1-type zinc finger protein 6 [Polymixia lowei]
MLSVCRNEEKEEQRGDFGRLSRRDMAQETNQSQAPLLCTTGCGFYGNPRNNGMCSVCYKDFLQRQNSNGRVSPPESSSTDSSIGESLLTHCSNSGTVLSTVPTATSRTDTASGLSSGVTATSTAPSEDESSGAKASPKTKDLQTPVSEDSAQGAVESEEKPKVQKKNRCFTCRKKIGLTGFDCRCGNVFCGAHRYSDIHNCTFDYRADAAEKIRKENPIIVGEKIQKI